MLYISELCEDCAVANEIDYEIDDAWTNIHGINDNGPRDQSVWRLTLTAHLRPTLFCENRITWLLKDSFTWGCNHSISELDKE